MMRRTNPLRCVVHVDCVTPGLTIAGEDGFLLTEDLETGNLCAVHNDYASLHRFTISNFFSKGNITPAEGLDVKNSESPNSVEIG
jgi:hypothetical protein